MKYKKGMRFTFLETRLTPSKIQERCRYLSSNCILRQAPKNAFAAGKLCRNRRSSFLLTTDAGHHCGGNSSNDENCDPEGSSSKLFEHLRTRPRSYRKGKGECHGKHTHISTLT